jgi:hypothetical protein
MSKFLISLFNSFYNNFYNTNLGQILTGAFVTTLYFFLSCLPTIIYYSNNKYFGDANDTYNWMPITSICLASAGILGIFVWLIYNSFKK